MECTDMSLESIEAMNRAAADAYLPYAVSIQEFLPAPLDEVELLTHFAPGPRLLDVGCGTARYANAFRMRDFLYRGCDLSPKVIEYVRASFPTLVVEVASYRRLPYADASFDALWCGWVLQHEPKRNVGPVLEELARVLIPEGVALITLPSVYESDEVIMTLAHADMPTYDSSWEFDEFSAVLGTSPFRIIHSYQDWVNGSMTFLCSR